MNRTLSTAAALCAAAGLTASAQAQVIEWDNAAGGIWHDATNWDPMVIPLSSGQSATIGLPGTYTVGIGAGISPALSGFRLTNPNATVAIANGRDLFLNGADVIIDGTVLVNETGSTSATRLLIGEPDLLINGSGEIVLNDSSTTAVGRAQFVDLIGGLSTTLGPNMTLRGSGQVNLVLTNDGTVRADADGLALVLQSASKANNGLFDVANNGLMVLLIGVDQTGGGELRVTDGTLRLTNSTVTGGTINNTGGTLEVAGGTATLDGVDVTGDIEIQNVRDLNLLGGLDMDGEILVNREGSTSATRVLIGETQALSGDLIVTLNDSSTTAAGRAQFVDAVGGVVVTLADTVLVQGSGIAAATFVNNGTVLANNDGLELAITGNAKTNNNLMRAADGGLLRLATVINQGPDGRIEADGGEVRLISTIAGGEIDSTNGLFEIDGGNATLDNVERVIGDIEIQNVRDLNLLGGLDMDGEILVNREGSTSATRVLIGDTQSLSGDLTITLNDSSSTAIGRAQFVDAVGGVVATLADTVLVQGSGIAGATFVNNGTILANNDGQELAITGSAKTNNSLIRATNGGLLRLATVINQGSDGRIVADGGEVRLISTIVGGEIDSTNGLFEIDGGNATLDGVERVTGDIEIQNVRDMVIRNSLTLDGTIVINRDGSTSATRLLMGTTNTIDGSGEIFLNGSAPTSTPGRAQLVDAVGGIESTFGPSVALTGHGLLNGNFTFEGTIAPGRTGSPVGETGILQSGVTLEMTDSTRVEIQIGGRGVGDFDHIRGTAAITVDGTLDASIIDGFEADTCENFVIISGSSVTGEFDTFIPPAPTSNQRWRLFYTGTSVELRATCTADIDGDCTLTLFDFLAFQNLFDMGSIEADFDGDGSLTLFDFLAFQNAFSRGCD